MLFSQQKKPQETLADTGMVQTKLFSEFSHQLSLEKPGKIASTQDILVTAQANGKVAKILAKEGDLVK